MKTFLRHLNEQLRSGLWFVAGLWTVAAIVAARLFVYLDAQFDDSFAEWFPRLNEISVDGVRSLLTTIASSVLTLAGLVFSATLVALSLASSQFGPRLLRNFIRSRMNQATFGVLIANFVYCITVLRYMSNEFVPHISLLSAFLFVLGSLTCFILFAHTIITSLQADEVVADVYGELADAVEEFFPDALPSDKEEREADRERETWDVTDEDICIQAENGGYLQAVKYDTLLEMATDMETQFRIVKRPGEFVHQRDNLVAIPEGFELEEGEPQKILNCFLIGSVRTAEQDFEFFVRQLVEVAMRALSPGINDPFTAITCIDFLSEAMTRIARRRLPRRIYHDEDGKKRVAIRPVSFQSLLDTSFLQIRQTGGSRPDVALALLEGLRSIAGAASNDEHRKAIRRHAEWVADTALESITAEFDRSCVKEKRDKVFELCGE